MFDFLKKKRAVTLVLGGGSARGLAHIGVLSVLERENIPIASVVGTSMGALIGAAYATGIPIKKMEELAYGFTLNKLLDPTMPRMGMLAGEKLEATIRELLDGKTFNDCKIPLAVVTTNMENGEEAVFRGGDLVKVVRASCSWAGIFNPVRIDGKLLSDGGIKDSVPTRIAKEAGADYILAVNVGFCVKHEKIENILQMMLQSFQIMGEELNKYQSLDADSVIEVKLGHDIDQTAFGKAKEIVRKGKEAAELKIEEIKKGLRIQ